MNIKGYLLTIPFALCVYAQSAAPVQESAPPTPEPKKLSNESEGSVVVVGGNSKLETYSVKQTTGYKLNKHVFTLKGHYLMGKANSSINAENWSAGLRYDYAFSEQLGIFAGETASADRFKNIHLQFDSDVGLKYTILKVSDKDYILSELGYRFTNFDYVAGESKTTHFARLYAEAAKSINDNVFGKLTLEFLPNVERTSKVLFNFEPSLNVTLTKIFSVKTAFLGQYDSEPTAEENFDYKYTLALIAKY